MSKYKMEEFLFYNWTYDVKVNRALRNKDTTFNN